jgi:hypothetical protein
MQKQGRAFFFALLLATIACRNSGDAIPSGATALDHPSTTAAGPPDLAALYAPYTALRGDLHLHSSTASFDSVDCGPQCPTFSASEQLAAARQAGLDFAALTEHDRNPNQPGSRIGAAQWQAALEAVEQANSADFLALPGYEWTSSQRGCFETNPQHPDFGHKIVILPAGATGRCDSDVCTTPDQLGEFVEKAGGVILTPHPWRVELLEANQAGLPAYVTRNYFDYQGDGPGGVFVGAEVGPDFQPLRWKVLCSHPGDDIYGRTGTLAEWQQALMQGKHLAAVSSSDRHFGFTPFGSRSTVLFARERTPAAILEALKARRTMAASLEPFEVRLALGGAIVGETVPEAVAEKVAATAARPAEGRLRVAAPPEQVAAIEVWSGDHLLQAFPPGAVNQDLAFALDGATKGPVWAKVIGIETDPGTGTQRTTITSPIWLEGGGAGLRPAQSKPNPHKPRPLKTKPRRPPTP